MSAVFKDISLEWDGHRYVVPAARRFEMIDLVEEQIPLGEIYAMAIDIGRLKGAAVSKGFGAILRFVGVTEVKDGRTIPITAETVFGKMFGNAALASEGPLMALQVLLAMVQPDVEPAAKPVAPSRKKPAVKRGNG